MGKKAKEVKVDQTGVNVELVLDKPAKKTGGDRYANADLGITVYVPQEISRSGDKPKPKLVMNISEISHSDSGNEFKLEKAASKTGGDKYSNGVISHYLPQSISRVSGGKPAEFLFISIS